MQVKVGLSTTILQYNRPPFVSSLGCVQYRALVSWVSSGLPPSTLDWVRLGQAAGGQRSTQHKAVYCSRFNKCILQPWVHLKFDFIEGNKSRGGDLGSLLPGPSSSLSLFQTGQRAWV